MKIGSLYFLFQCVFRYVNKPWFHPGSGYVLIYFRNINFNIFSKCNGQLKVCSEPNCVYCLLSIHRDIYFREIILFYFYSLFFSSVQFVKKNVIKS